MNLVVIIIVLFILKFIYDTYLTNNTESRYKEYKSTVYGIRTDGIYIFEQKGTSTWGEKFIITHTLIFNSKGFVAYVEQEGELRLKKGDIEEIVLDFGNVSTIDHNCVRFVKNDNEIDIIFNGNKFPDKQTWIEKNLGANILKGIIKHNCLYLTFENIYFDEAVGAPMIREVFCNEKFTLFN